VAPRASPRRFTKRLNRALFLPFIAQISDQWTSGLDRARISGWRNSPLNMWLGRRIIAHCARQGWADDGNAPCKARTSRSRPDPHVPVRTARAVWVCRHLRKAAGRIRLSAGARLSHILIDRIPVMDYGERNRQALI